jgi:hypothetical protein
MKSIRCILVAVLLYLIAPFGAGIMYNITNPNHTVRQAWLNEVVSHLRNLRVDCKDKEIREVIDYTINRYSKVGGFDVMFMKCPELYPFEFIGLNSPLCPGLTLNPEIMTYSTQIGAMVLLHESCHDYRPFYHPLVNRLVNKVEAYANRTPYIQANNSL